jgi:hypothetical protein
MIITLSVVLFALLVLLFLIRLAKGHAAEVRGADDLRQQVLPVDARAFRNLTNPAEEEFLRTNLSPSQFRAIQRQRLRAALSYVSAVAGNAAVLARMGESARRSSDMAVAEAGRKLVDSAIRLRISALQAQVKLCCGMVFPGAWSPAAGLPEKYESMTRQGLYLGRLQYPARGVARVL